MSKKSKFSFKSFCKHAGICQTSIDILTCERLDDEFTFGHLDFDALQALEIASGDIYRLEDAIDELFAQKNKKVIASAMLLPTYFILLITS